MYQIRRYFSSFTKSPQLPTTQQLSTIKTHLLNSKWHLHDDSISSFKSKELYVTVQSLLDPQHPPFMSHHNGLKPGAQAEYLNSRFRKGEILPYGYSLAYCNPLSNEYNEISTDGYDNYHAPTLEFVDFFKRRMWVGGSFSYNYSNPLKFGDDLKFEESVERVKSMSGGNLIFTDYKRTFTNNKGLSILENRRFCYINDTYKDMLETTNNTDVKKDPDHCITVTPSEISNFRMSALTFNSHLIHYDPVYSQTIEKYPKVVIQGPLLIQLSLQYFWNVTGSADNGIHIDSFKYKISKAVFVEDEIKVCMKSINNEVYNIWIELVDGGEVCFDAVLKVIN